MCGGLSPPERGTGERFPRARPSPRRWPAISSDAVGGSSDRRPRMRSCRRWGSRSRVRALVISDTHFGAWTGEDILRDPDTIALLEPHLNVDEVIFLGDMFDLLFGSQREAFLAAEGLFGLLREKLQGKRFVFLAGNHDHHFVQRESEELLELELASGRA